MLSAGQYFVPADCLARVETWTITDSDDQLQAPCLHMTGIPATIIFWEIYLIYDWFSVKSAKS